MGVPGFNLQSVTQKKVIMKLIILYIYYTLIKIEFK
jgi:hypothetical protein